MKYQFVNRLQDFEFHDSVWTLDSFDSNTIVLHISGLNVHKLALSEAFDTDMEIADAYLTFRGVSKLTCEPSRAWKQDADGNSYTDEPKIIHNGEAAKEFFVSEMKDSPIIFNVEHTGGSCEIGGCGRDPYFTFNLSFQESEVSWDAFRKTAWYQCPRTSNIQKVGE